MKLTKNFEINVYEVIADYKVKVKNSSFIAILKFAHENDGVIFPIFLQKEFLAPLSLKACENLLERLTKMGYFTKEEKLSSNNYLYIPDNEDDFRKKQYEYVLTDLGHISAEKEEFYDKRHGLLKIYVSENNKFVEQKIIKIEELKHDPDKKEMITDLNQNLKSLQTLTIKLQKKIYILDKFEEKCKVLAEESADLVFTAKETNSVVKIMDFEKIENFSERQIRNKILKNDFRDNFLYKKEILKIDFNPNKLELQRDIRIPEPQINQTIFDPIIINNVMVNPYNIEDAKKWHFSLLKEQINKYFLSDDEFLDFSNQITNKFELYTSQLQNIHTRNEFAEKLNDKEDFYKKAKLETINYLNY